MICRAVSCSMGMHVEGRSLGRLRRRAERYRGGRFGIGVEG